MNTTITIDVVQHPGESTVDIGDGIEAGFGEFDRIVKQYTRFNEDSELSNLNRRSGEWTEVSAEFLMLIGQMLDLAKATEGAFDPTVIDFLETYGYDPNYDFSKLDNPDLDMHVTQMAQSRPDWKNIEVDAAGSKVRLAKGQRLDLGGIGKGYAIDCAYAKLDKFESFLIDAGGDVRVKGLNAKDQPWKLGLKHLQQARAGKDAQKTDSPPQPQIIGTIHATNLALACSGSWARKVKQFHHIINPKTGKPVEDVSTLYVTAPTATVADSWATAIFVGGKELLEKIPKGMEVMMIYTDGKVFKTKGFELT